MNQTSGSPESNTSTSAKTQTVAVAEQDGSPKFGRLLAVLLFAVMLIVVITFATEAYYSN